MTWFIPLSAHPFPSYSTEKQPLAEETVRFLFCLFNSHVLQNENSTPSRYRCTFKLQLLGGLSLHKTQETLQSNKKTNMMSWSGSPVLHRGHDEALRGQFCTDSWIQCPGKHKIHKSVHSWQVSKWLGCKTPVCRRELNWVSGTSPLEKSLLPAKGSQFSRYLFTVQTPPYWSQATSVSSDWSKWVCIIAMAVTLTNQEWLCWKSFHGKQAQENLSNVCHGGPAGTPYF